MEDIGLIREQAAFQDRHMNMKSAEQKAALRRRTKAFASKIVRFYCGLDKTREEIRVLGKQMLRAGTSVAANHREASRARSSAEFVAKVELCAQEADETQLWLELLRDDCGVPAPCVDPIWDEADQLIAIFVTMAKRTKEADQKPETGELRAET